MYKKYPSDLTDGEFKFLKKCLPTQKNFGRPRKYQRREILNAIFYLLRTGCAWRYLPNDYPDWRSVYHYASRVAKERDMEKIEQTLAPLPAKESRETRTSIGGLSGQPIGQNLIGSPL